LNLQHYLQELQPFCSNTTPHYKVKTYRSACTIFQRTVDSPQPLHGESDCSRSPWGHLALM